VEEADRVAVAAVVAAVAAALAAVVVVVVEAEPVVVAAGATAAPVIKKHGQIPTSKQFMRPGGHAKRALSSTQNTQTNATCAVEPTPERYRGDVKREAARALVMQAAVHVLQQEWQQERQQERQQEQEQQEQQQQEQQQD
jgi:hypothetical protein